MYREAENASRSRSAKVVGHQPGTNDTVIKQRFGRRAIVQWGQLTMLLWPTGEGLIQMGAGSSLPQLGRVIAGQMEGPSH
jgi:hypothetical protein